MTEHPEIKVKPIYSLCLKCQLLGDMAPCDECFYGRGVIKTADELLEFLGNSSGDITFHAEGHFIKDIHLSALKDLASLASRFDELDVRLAHENRLDQWRLDNK